MEHLSNERWGIETNCFVCEPRNEAGLRIPFFHDEVTGPVTARFTLDNRFSGAPAYVHGGVLLAVLDEAMAWAAIAVAHRWAVTGETTTRFEHPVRIGHEYTVTARIADALAESSTLAATAVITDAQRPRVCGRSRRRSSSWAMPRPPTRPVRTCPTLGAEYVRRA